MKKTIISFVLILTLFLTSCSSGDEVIQKLDELQQQQQSMQATIDALAQRVDQLEAAQSPQVEDAVAEPIEEVEPFDYLAVSDVEALIPYLPDGFVHLIPAKYIVRAVMLKEPDIFSIILTYNESISNEEAEQYARDLNGELEKKQEGYSGEPCWRIHTTEAEYSVQNLEPDHWYGDYLDSEISEMAVTISYPLNEAPELSEWFNERAFDYDSFLLPKQLSGSPNEKAVTLGETRENGIPIVSVSSVWTGLSEEEITGIFTHYQEALKDNNWFFVQGAPEEFATIFSQLDEDRTISVGSKVEGDGTHSCNLTINYSYLDQE